MSPLFCSILNFFTKLIYQYIYFFPDTIIRIKNETTEDYFCEECLSGFLTLSDFEIHIQEGHSEEVLFTSFLSDQKYSVENKSEALIAMTPQWKKASKVTLHNRYNAGTPSLPCSNDQEKLKSKRLGNHSNNKPTGEKHFVCDHCDKGFSRKADFKRHLIIHTTEKPFVCDQCHKRFSRKDHLERHLLNHTDEKPFVCDHCDKRFSRKADFKTHLIIHTSEKPFICDQCEKSFSKKGDLNRHLLIHTGQKSFVCDQCNKCFTQKSSLKTHSLIHTGEKPFVCDYCYKGFTDKSNLNKHLKIHL